MCNYFRRILRAGVIKLVLRVALYLISSPEGARCNYLRKILRAGVIKLVFGSPCIQSLASRGPGVIILEGYQRYM